MTFRPDGQWGVSWAVTEGARERQGTGFGAWAEERRARLAAGAESSAPPPSTAGGRLAASALALTQTATFGEEHVRELSGARTSIGRRVV
jgi:hypothetical protein